MRTMLLLANSKSIYWSPKLNAQLHVHTAATKQFIHDAFLWGAKNKPDVLWLKGTINAPVQFSAPLCYFFAVGCQNTLTLFFWDKNSTLSPSPPLSLTQWQSKVKYGANCFIPAPAVAQVWCNRFDSLNGSWKCPWRMSSTKQSWFMLRTAIISCPQISCTHCKCH